MKFHLVIALLAFSAGLCTSLTTSVQPKQSATSAVSLLFNSLSSMMPGVVSNVLPIVFMFGLGALLVPALGLGTLFRENKLGRSLPAFNSYMNPVVESVQEILDKFLDTLDKMDQQYNN